MDGRCCSSVVSVGVLMVGGVLGGIWKIWFCGWRWGVGLWW